MLLQTPTPITKEIIMWIALPWTVGTPSSRPRFSVFVSPRLEGSTTTPLLLAGGGTSRHCHFVDWPAVVTDLTFQVAIEGRGTIASGLRPRNIPDPELWRKLFARETPVESFGAQPLVPTSAESVRSFTPSAASDAIRKIYAGSGRTGRLSSALAIKGDAVSMASAGGDNVAPLREIIRFHDIIRREDEAVAQRMNNATKSVVNTVPTAIPPSAEGKIVTPRIAEGTSASRLVLPDAVPEGFAVGIKRHVETPIVVEAPRGDQSINGMAGRHVIAPGVRPVIFRRVNEGWDAEEQLEFHEIVSALSSYPELMRQLGLILEFELTGATLGDLGRDGRVRILPHTPPNTCDIDSMSISPWTAYRVTHHRAMTLLAARPEVLAVDHGFLLNAGPDRHRLIHLDVYGAALKISAAAQTADTPPKIVSVPTPESEPRLPALHHAGIALVDEKMDEEILRVAKRRETYEQLFAATTPSTTESALPTLFADDVLQGMRPDVRRDGGVWRSLCSRDGEYRVGKSPSPFFINDEGLVSETLELTDDEKARTSRTVFRWEGWSLVAPRPTDPIDDHGNVINAVESAQRRGRSNFPLTAKFIPHEHTLERLRFGSRYDFRLRTVDLAGNSLTASEADTVVEDVAGALFVDDVPFRRVEPVDAPMFVAMHKVHIGERSDQLVIRADHHRAAVAREWLVLPPPTSQSRLEMHGVFDALKPDSSYELIRRYEGTVPSFDTDDVAALRMDANHIQYLADPLCRGASFCGFPVGKGVSARFAEEERQPLLPGSAHPLRFRLAGGDDSLVSTSFGVVATIPAGRVRTVRLSAMTSKYDHPRFELWQWLAAEDPSLHTAEGIASTCHGEVEHITPGRLVSLIHAVPKPLAAKGARAIGFQELACVQREPAETLASIAGTLLIDAPSTGKIDIKAEWTDTVDDASLSAWARVARTAQPFQNVSTSTRDEDSLVPIAGSHKFDDTKHHVVQYRAAAATRFVDFYEGAKTDVSGTYVTISEPRDVHIPSTARPALPDVLYVVPTFIGEEKSSGRSKEVMRRCGMRIYLRRGWFSSGEGERLAIVFPASGTIDPLLEPLLTEWGSDPTWQSEPVRRRPNESDFPGGVPADAIAVVKRESSSADTAAEAKFPLRILTYPVAVDAEKSLLYADIDIVPPDGAYMPFVRLALARYQEHSVQDLHLSPLVRAAFVQVTPERRLTVTNRGHGEYEVTLQGTSPLVPPHTNEFPLQATSVEVTLERKVDGLSESHANWFPVPAFAPVELTRDNDGWRRRLLVGSFWRDAHRFVIREYEHYLADATADGATAREVKRLVYAYPLRLEDI